MVLKNDPNPPENSVTADQMVLNIKPLMTKEQALQVLELSKIYRKSSFPAGMIEEAMEVLK